MASLMYIKWLQSRLAELQRQNQPVRSAMARAAAALAEEDECRKELESLHVEEAPTPPPPPSNPKKPAKLLSQSADNYPVVADLGLTLFELRVQKGRPVKIGTAISKVLKDPKWKGKYSEGTLHAYASFAVRSGYFKEKYDIVRVALGVYGFTSDLKIQA